MSSFDLQVIAVDKIFYDGKCRQVVVTGVDGSIGIMAHHENAVIALQEGFLNIETEDGEWIEAASGIGHVQVLDNRVVILVDFAEKPEEIDEKRKFQKRYEGWHSHCIGIFCSVVHLWQKQSIQEFHMSQANISRAMARLAARRHMRGGV